jgi:hypothetical protein
LRQRRIEIAGPVFGHDRPDLFREHRRGHGAGRAGVEIGEQRHRFLAVERPLDMVAGGIDQRRQLVGGKGALDLEIGDLLKLARQAGEQSTGRLTPESGAS